MPANKNALIRYKTIDNCLRNRYRRWTLNDLVDACSDALKTFGLFMIFPETRVYSGIYNVKMCLSHCFF